MPNAMFFELLEKLKAYKKKYYLNRLFKGLIFFFSLALTAFLFISILEYYGQYSSVFRFAFFISYVGLTIFGLVKWIIKPSAQLLNLQKQLSNEEAAKEIGHFFPNVKDKLLNTLQLNSLNQKENVFIQASIDQKTKELSVVPFTKAVDYKENNRYLKYLGIPIVVILVLLLFIPQLFTESTARIINYNREYSYPAPFTFNLLNKELKAFKNEDFLLEIDIEGEAIPNQVFIFIGNRKIKMARNTDGHFSHTFRNIQNTETFALEAAGYSSENYKLEMLLKPNLKIFEVDLNYPPYLNKKSEQIFSAGNITIPEGTRVTWNFKTEDVDQINLQFSDKENQIERLQSKNNRFSFSRTVKNNLGYKLDLENKHSKGKEIIAYNLEVIPDQYPQISTESFNDSVLYSHITMGGLVSDDYGLTELKVYYRIQNTKTAASANTNYKSFTIPLQKRTLRQNFIYNWSLDSLNLNANDKLEYHLVVWDNDGVNGSKSTKSNLFSFTIPSKQEIKEDIKESTKNTETAISNTLSKSQKLKKNIEDFENKLKTKNKLSWQDKKALEELMQQHEELKKDIEQLKKEYNKLEEKQDKFNKPNEELKKKMEELQKLMEQLLDEETKKLYEELQKMMEQKLDKNELQQILEQIKQQDQTLNKELERTLEWFKQIQFDQKLEEIKKDLEKMAQDQKQLADEKDKTSEEKLAEQEKLNQEFNELKKELDNLDKINESLQNKNEMDNMSQEKQEIEDKQQKSTESLKNNQQKKAGQSQKEAGDKMQEMADKLGEMQSQMQQEQAEENMEDLRAILENLIHLSFDQEDLMKDIRKVNQSDPRYIELAQKQLKLKEDSKIIEDSLISLANRVFQIQSFITRETEEMNRHMDRSIKDIRDRRPDLAAGNQQYTMTSINNLALMLNDVLKQMQEQMAQMKGGGQMCNKPGKNKKPGLGELQKQLNQQMEQMKKGGQKPGENGMSKEIAKMAAQQEMIRNALKEMQKKSGGDKSGKELSEIIKSMEQSEKDLVNKNISQELLLRQKEILTRLLEAEKSLQERETDNERESDKGKELNRDMPPSMEKYLKEKEKQLELLKTVNPSLTPYYKREVDEYFKKIGK
jgi:hypothetical protein